MWKLIPSALIFGLAAAQFGFVPPDFDELPTTEQGDVVASNKCGEGSLEGRICVPYHRCDPKTNTTLPDDEEVSEDDLYDYSHVIDIRLGERNPCPKTLDFCCKTNNDQATPPRPTTPSPRPTTQPPTKAPISMKSQCGHRNPNGVGVKITGNTHQEAEYGEFPWMVAIVNATYDPAPGRGFAECGGSLIAPRVVLTAAHCIVNRETDLLKVRGGEWDVQITSEQYPYQEREIEQVITHEKYRSGTLIYDVALLVLKAPFNKAPHIGTICLPNENQVVLSKDCYATGWGKNAYGQHGQYQMILKKIDLPMVPRPDCQTKLRKSALGESFRLHSTFTCAGGVPGKDTCEGDGGSPLVCPDPGNPSRYVQVGIVSWGIECGTTTPGVYGDVAKFRGWVDHHMERLNLGKRPYVE